MRNHALPFVCIMVMAAVAGCAKESVVEVPAGHVGLVCSDDNSPESCGLWLHDPGKTTVREGEKLRVIDCSPFVRSHHTVGRTRDSVEIDIGLDASFEVDCNRFEVREAFSRVVGDVSSDLLYSEFGRTGLEDSLHLVATTYLSHEIAKDPERLLELSAAIIARSANPPGPLKLKRHIVTSVVLRDGSGERTIYDLIGK
jgi:hypothetical protein